jgi:hypothetical protein
MNNKTVGAASVAIALVVAACGGSTEAVSTESFSDQLSSVCRRIGRGIGNLDEATSLADVRANARDASALYESGLNELKKLAMPTDDEEFAGDVEDLIASFEDQLDTLDAIAKAANDSDQDAVDSRISTLSDQAADSSDLADSLDASRCQLDPVSEVAPAATEPPVPMTLPVATLPVDTPPVDTAPVDTALVDTFPLETVPLSTNKVVVSSADLVPLGDYSFADAPADSIGGFHSLLDLSPTVAAQSGRITGVDVLDSAGQPMGRVFAFESDTDPLSPGSLEEVTPFLTADIPTTPLTVGTQEGVTWTESDGTAYFLLGTDNVLLWALAPSADHLVPALQAWGESVSQ